MCGLCAGPCEWISLSIFPSSIPELQHAPLPLKVLWVRERVPTPPSSVVFHLDSHLSPSRSWECVIVGSLLVHKRTTSIHKFLKLAIAQIWGEPTPCPYNIICPWSRGLHCSQMSFCLGTPKLKILKFSKLRLLEFWMPINFLWRPFIEVKPKAKLWPSSKSFQIYVAHHIRERISGQLLTFSGWGSNWHSDFRPLFWP